MQELTDLPEEMLDSLGEGLVALVLAGKYHPEGLPIFEKRDLVHPNDLDGNPSKFAQGMQEIGLVREHSINVNSPFIYDLQSFGYALVLVDSKTGRTRLKLTDWGYEIYQNILKSMVEPLLGIKSKV